MKQSNIQIIGVPEDEKRERWAEGLFEQIIAETFPNLGKETSIHIQDGERTLSKINKKRSTPQRIIMKLANLKAKETILRTARERRFLTYIERNIRITSDLSTETWKTKKGWQDIFRVLNEKNMYPRILYPARLHLEWMETRSFQDWQSLKEYVTTKLILQEILRGIL